MAILDKSKVFYSLIFLCFCLDWVFSSSLYKYEQQVREASLRDEELPPVSFDDIYSSDFSYSSFSPNWVDESTYLYRDTDGAIKLHDVQTGNDQIVVSSDLYESSKANGYSISEDQQYFLARTSYVKQWRHSYNATYKVYDIKSETVVFETPENTVQYITWSPTGSQVVWVENNDIYLIKDLSTDLSDPANITQITNNGEINKIFNGVPDWVYEEEMVFSRDVIYWSPTSNLIGYLVTNDTDVEQVEFSMYNNGQYPKTVKVAYPKAGSSNSKVELKVYDVINGKIYNSLVPTELADQDHLFSRLYWMPGSDVYLVYWLNRISSKSVVQKCQIPADPATSTDMDCSNIESASEETETGWVGDEGGIPFQPSFIQSASSKFFSAFSDDAGFWQAAVVDMENDTRTLLTDGTKVVTNIEAYDSANDILYFMAAYPLPRNRNLMKIKVSEAMDNNITINDDNCITCSDDFDRNRCGWVSSSFGPQLKYLVVNCGGPDVPISYLVEMNSDGTMNAPVVMEDNQDVVDNKAMRKWPTKTYGEFKSKNSDTTILYQEHRPLDFDENKQYPLLIEVYGGAGYQKVQDRWTRSWAPIHMVSTYDMIVVSLDARGSAFRGNDIMHSVYQKLGQFEKIDTNEVGEHFAAKSYIDAGNIAVWGWSYGGYTTSFTISLGTGVFKCGMAVAPLASRYYYDTIHTERFMRTPDENKEGYEKCSILNSDMQNFKKSWYSIIHGTT